MHALHWDSIPNSGVFHSTLAGVHQLWQKLPEKVPRHLKHRLTYAQIGLTLLMLITVPRIGLGTALCPEPEPVSETRRRSEKPSPGLPDVVLQTAAMCDGTRPLEAIARLAEPLQPGWSPIPISVGS